MQKINLLLTACLAIASVADLMAQSKDKIFCLSFVMTFAQSWAVMAGSRSSLRILIDGRHRVYYLTGRIAILLFPGLPAQAC